jgi:ABC-type uncharacterized transport system substrate-binding protein
MKTSCGRLCSAPILIILIVWALSSCYLLQDVPTKRADQKSVLIINSDKSVEKYATIHQEFKSELSADSSILIEEVDLASTFSTDTVKRKIEIFQHPDIVHAIGSKAYRVAESLIKDKTEPVIVFSGIFDWRKFKTDMGSNTYGMALELTADDQLSIMKEDLFPEIRTIGVLYSETHNQKWFDHAKSQAEEMDLKLQGKIIESSSDILDALGKLLPKVDALWLIPDPIMHENVRIVLKVFKEAATQQKPIFTYNPQFSEKEYGAVLTIAVKLPSLGKQMAGVAKMSLDKKNFQLGQVLYPTDYRVILNRKKAEEYGIKVTEDEDLLKEVEFK